MSDDAPKHAAKNGPPVFWWMEHADNTVYAAHTWVEARDLARTYWSEDPPHDAVWKVTDTRPEHHHFLIETKEEKFVTPIERIRTRLREDRETFRLNANLRPYIEELLAIIE